MTIRKIVEAVARQWDTTVEELRKPAASKEVTHARHVAMYLVHELTDASIRQIGREFGVLHHTTVVCAISRVARLRRERAAFDEAIQGLLAALSGAAGEAAGR